MGSDADSLFEVVCLRNITASVEKSDQNWFLTLTSSEGSSSPPLRCVSAEASSETLPTGESSVVGKDGRLRMTHTFSLNVQVVDEITKT